MSITQHHPDQPSVKAQRRTPWVASQRLRDALSTYLPLVLMGLLALATWWLVKNSPQPQAPRVEREARRDADYLMTGATLQRFDASGRLRIQIEGATIRHFPHNDTLEVDQVRIKGWGTDGSLTTATARRATASSNATEVTLEGGAQVERRMLAANEGKSTDGKSNDVKSTEIKPTDTKPNELATFRSEYLHVDFDARRVKSHRPVVLTLGENTVQAGGFDHDDVNETTKLLGPIKMVMPPSALKKSR